MGTAVYAVAPVFQDLRPAEAYLQIGDMLTGLEGVVNGLFNRIQDRLKTERSRLDGLSARVALASAKVQTLKTAHSNRATVVLSPATYPAAQPSPYVPLHGDEEAGGGHVTWTKSRVVRATPLQGAGPRDTLFQELLDLAPVEKQSSSAVESQDGLGRLPDNLPSIASLLLFNSPANPYRKYLSLDNLAAKIGKERTQTEDGPQLHDAPNTVAFGDTMLGLEAEQIVYKPVLGDVPTLNFPAALNLPMLAVDLSWASGAALSIAPSSLPSLPDLASISVATPAPAPVAVAAAPPPPAPVAKSAPVPPPSAKAAPPPPPPPASFSAPLPPPEVPAEVAELGGRGSLLDDIRKGHKNRLKKTKNPEEGGEGAGGEAEGSGKKKSSAKAKEKEKEPPAASGDIFTDLINALNRRRNNMAGRGDPSQKKETSKKSDEISGPPPPSSGEDIKMPQPRAEEWDE